MWWGSSHPGAGPDYRAERTVVGSGERGHSADVATDPGMGGKFSVLERSSISKDELSERLAAQIGSLENLLQSMACWPAQDQWQTGSLALLGCRGWQLEDETTLHIELKSTSEITIRLSVCFASSGIWQISH